MAVGERVAVRLAAPWKEIGEDIAEVTKHIRDYFQNDILCFMGALDTYHLLTRCMYVIHVLKFPSCVVVVVFDIRFHGISVREWTPGRQVPAPNTEVRPKHSFAIPWMYFY